MIAFPLAESREDLDVVVYKNTLGEPHTERVSTSIQYSVIDDVILCCVLAGEVDVILVCRWRVNHSISRT